MYRRMNSSYVNCWFRLLFLCSMPFGSCVVCFCCVRFSFASTKPRDWLERKSPKWLYYVSKET